VRPIPDPIPFCTTPGCGKPVHNGYKCLEHKRAYDTNYRNRKKKAGICIDCEKPALPKRIRCEAHTQRAKEQARRKYLERKSKLSEKTRSDSSPENP
jgi:hypothetical protein